MNNPTLTPRQVMLALALAALCFSGCNREAGADAKKKGGKKKGGEVVPVAVAKVVARSVPLEIQVIGNVEAYSTVLLKARVTGAIEKVHFNEGDFVRKGDKLFTIDPAPFLSAVNQAEANLARDKAQLLQARANLSRDEAQHKFVSSQASRFASLQKEGVISKEQAEQYQANADVVGQAIAADRAAIASAEASVQAGEAAVKTARIQLGYSTVFAPVDGRTGNLVAKEGNLATGNVTELIAISQVQPVYVTFSVPESQLSVVKEAMARGRLVVSAAPPEDPQKPETGTLTFVDSAVDATTGTIKLKGTFQNAGRRLWPGQFVRVTLRLGVRGGALMVPNQAVQTGQEGSFVYRVQADNSVQMAKVVTGGRVDQDIVIDDGVAEGDTVVTEGQLRLAPGMKIRLRGEGGPGNAAKGKGKGKKKEE
ncbi:MAG: efflux RND transporter periplasmic adaptor subunit [Bryobacteraceae bacterium]|nr:efflux RND transporter periplasmic adaptor subunit [Bryobacteraceae bacterium]